MLQRPSPRKRAKNRTVRKSFGHKQPSFRRTTPGRNISWSIITWWQWISTFSSPYSLPCSFFFHRFFVLIWRTWLRFLDRLFRRLLDRAFSVGEFFGVEEHLFVNEHGYFPARIVNVLLLTRAWRTRKRLDGRIWLCTGPVFVAHSAARIHVVECLSAPFIEAVSEVEGYEQLSVSKRKPDYFSYFCSGHKYEPLFIEQCSSTNFGMLFCGERNR